MFAKTEVFENAPQSGGFWKRRFSVLVWTGENGGFRKRLRHCSFACSSGNSYFSPSMRSAKKVRSSKDWWRKRMFLSVFGGRKRCENANVDVNTFMRFQETENGGFRKRISVDGTLHARETEDVRKAGTLDHKKFKLAFRVELRSIGESEFQKQEKWHILTENTEWEIDSTISCASNARWTKNTTLRKYLDSDSLDISHFEPWKRQRLQWKSVINSRRQKKR